MVAQATVVAARLRTMPCEVVYGPNVCPAASTVMVPSFVKRTTASLVWASSMSLSPRTGAAGGAPVGRSVTSMACGFEPMVGVDVGDGELVVSVAVEGAVAGGSCPSELVPLVANIAVGTITAIAAATPRPVASWRRRRIEVALPRTSSNASGVADRFSARWLQRAAEFVLQVVVGVAHRSSSGVAGFRWAGVRSRSAASARLVWDFTVPTEMPRTSAVSASDSCS